jgi:hypothetical protein
MRYDRHPKSGERPGSPPFRIATPEFSRGLQPTAPRDFFLHVARATIEFSRRSRAAYAPLVALYFQ